MVKQLDEQEQESWAPTSLDDLGIGMIESWTCGADDPHDEDAGRVLHAHWSGDAELDELHWRTPWLEAGLKAPNRQEGQQRQQQQREREEKETGRTTLELRWQLSSWPMMRYSWKL